MGLTKFFVGALGIFGGIPGAIGLTTFANAISPDYASALKNSLLFYKAQRSGKLPDNDVPWRHDSFVNLTTKEGVDVSGGFFDAGDTVKFNLPQAVTITSLSTGVLYFEEGYKKAGEKAYEDAIGIIKWGADYLANCVVVNSLGRRLKSTDETKIIAQVGSGELDHIQWKRPDEIDPSTIIIYELDSSKPGSDVAGAIAAALSSSAIVMKKAGDTERANLYIQKAKKALEFGIAYKGFYSNSVPDAAKFYKSNSFYDDLAEGAVWLFKATNEKEYLELAEELFDEHLKKESGEGKWPSNDWDNRVWAVAVMLNEVAPNGTYAKLYDKFSNEWIHVGSNGAVEKTSDGFGWLDYWGVTRHNGNAMFLISLNKNADYSFIKKQVNYILGENNLGTSFMVGFGSKYPRYPHHRGSSCPQPPEKCGWEYYESTKPNPNILLGGLVSGPTLDGTYMDKRDNYVQNEVAIDYSYGLTGVLAAILQEEK